MKAYLKGDKKSIIPNKKSKMRTMSLIMVNSEEEVIFEIKKRYGKVALDITYE